MVERDGVGRGGFSNLDYPNSFGKMGRAALHHSGPLALEPRVNVSNLNFSTSLQVLTTGTSGGTKSNTGRLVLQYTAYASYARHQGLHY